MRVCMYLYNVDYICLYFNYPSKGVNCDRLQDPFNGQVTVTGTSPGSEAFYTCDSGFGLIGDSTRDCLPNGEWTGHEPTYESMYTYIVNYVCKYAH